MQGLQQTRPDEPLFTSCVAKQYTRHISWRAQQQGLSELHRPVGDLFSAQQKPSQANPWVSCTRGGRHATCRG